LPTTDDLADRIRSLELRAERTEAVLAIQDLKARYGDLVDRRFARGQVVDDGVLRRIASDVAALFTEDGVWDGGPGLGTVTGRAAIAERLGAPTLIFSRHLFVKPRIEVDGDCAQGRWDLLSPCLRLDGSAWWMCGIEDDEYARVDGVWLHRSMTLTTLFMTPAGEGWSTIFA